MGFTVCDNWKESEKCRQCFTALGKFPCWKPKHLESQDEVDSFYRYRR